VQRNRGDSLRRVSWISRWKTRTPSIISSSTPGPSSTPTTPTSTTRPDPRREISRAASGQGAGRRSMTASGSRKRRTRSTSATKSRDEISTVTPPASPGVTPPASPGVTPPAIPGDVPVGARSPRPLDTASRSGPSSGSSSTSVRTDHRSGAAACTISFIQSGPASTSPPLTFLRIASRRSFIPSNSCSQASLHLACSSSFPASTTACIQAQPARCVSPPSSRGKTFCSRAGVSAGSSTKGRSCPLPPSSCAFTRSRTTSATAGECANTNTSQPRLPVSSPISSRCRANRPHSASAEAGSHSPESASPPLSSRPLTRLRRFPSSSPSKTLHRAPAAALPASGCDPGSGDGHRSTRLAHF
jgi:hypothetical protein